MSEPDTDQLLDRARHGDNRAVPQLLDRHRERLRRMVRVHLDRRLIARVDPSDVVQETFAEAARKMDNYLRHNAMPFYPWLRTLAWDRLVELHKYHIRARRRSIAREEMQELLPDESVLELGMRVMDSRQSPSQELLRDELRRRIHSALDQLSAADREVLVLRQLEELSVRETAAVLGITETAVKTRQYRAIRRLHELLSCEGGNVT